MKKSNVSTLSFLMAVVIGLTFCISPAFAENSSVILDSGQSADLRGTPDSTPPVLTSIAIDKTEVEAPGMVTVTAKATDDISGIRSISAFFVDSKNEKELYVHFEKTTEASIYSGVVEITKFRPSGEYYLESVSLRDNGENKSYYYSKNYTYLSDGDLILPQEIGLKVTNLIQDDSDSKAPILKNVTISAKESVVPATIEVTAKATDDISGVNSISLNFVNCESQKKFFVRLEKITDSDIYTGEININKYEPSGEFYLESVGLRDVAENKSYYYSQKYPYLSDDDLVLPEEITFRITNSNQEFSDSQAPILESISVNKIQVKAPGTVTVTAKATDDISGIRSISAFFVDSKNEKKLYVHFEKTTEIGTYCGKVEIAQFQPSGEYYLESVGLRDNGENKSYYYSKYHAYLSDDDLLLPQEVTFRVSNGDDSEFTTNTTSSTLVSDIKQQPDDATVYINYKTGGNLTADVFEAIKGTNKTIILESDGIQWEFNGKDIEASKSIDLNVSIDKIRSSLTGNAQNIQNIVKDVPTMVLSFANNGKLPGKATIRIKADYAFRKYVGEENLYVYYYDNTTGKLVSIAQNIDVSQEGDLSFEIDHNSDFIITQSAIQTGGDSPIIDNPIYRPSGSGGSSSGGSSGGSSGSSSRKSSPMLAIKQADISLNSKMTNAIKRAIRAAAIKGQKQAVAAVAITDLELSTASLQALQRSIQAMLKGQNIEVIPKIVFSGIKGGQKEYSLSFNPLKAKITDTLKLELTQKEPILQSLFEKHFTNHLNTVHSSKVEILAFR